MGLFEDDHESELNWDEYVPESKLWVNPAFDDETAAAIRSTDDDNIETECPAGACERPLFLTALTYRRFYIAHGSLDCECGEPIVAFKRP